MPRFLPVLFGLLLLALMAPTNPVSAQNLLVAPGYCAPQTEVAPGTCVCPPSTSFRMSVGAGNSCATTGQCVCGQGTWNGSACVLPPPPPPPPPANCPMACGPGTVCVNGYCVKHGPLRVSLVWDRPGDLDLRIVTPAGEEVNYTHPRGQGVEMDRDDRHGTGPENIFWAAQPPAGNYAICVDSRLRGITANFTLYVVLPSGQTQTFTGSRTGSTVDPACRVGGRTHVTTVAIVPVQVPPPPYTQPGYPGAQPGYPGAQPGYPGYPPVAQPPGVVPPANPPAPTTFEIVPQRGGQPTRRDIVLQFIGWDDQRYTVGVEGNQFVIAPNGDWNQARRDTVLQFVGGDQRRYSARLEANGQWTLAPGADFGRSRSEGSVQILGWDGSAALVRVVR